MSPITEHVNGGAKDKILLVEGRDDCFVVLHLCKQAECSSLAFSISASGDIERVKRQAKTRLHGAEPLERLGLIIDADEQPIEERWQAFRGLLEPHGFDLPPSPSESGTITESNGKKAGIWIMPNNRDNGALEDFLLQLADHDGRDAATAYIKDSMNSRAAKLNPIHKSKGIAHAYLAIQENPGQPFGTAITSKAFEVDAKLAKSFTNWLTALFGSDT